MALAEIVSENIYSVPPLFCCPLNPNMLMKPLLCNVQELKNVINRREKEGHRIKWQWEQMERPKVVNVRLASDEASGIDLAQVTVRLRHRQVRENPSLPYPFHTLKSFITQHRLRPHLTRPAS